MNSETETITLSRSVFGKNNQLLGHEELRLRIDEIIGFYVSESGAVEICIYAKDKTGFIAVREDAARVARLLGLTLRR